MTKDRLKRNLIKTALLMFFIIYAFTILYPILLMFLTSLKENREIFTNPFGFPETLNLSGYIKLLTISNYPTYFRNSIVVTIISLFTRSAIFSLLYSISSRLIISENNFSNSVS